MEGTNRRRFGPASCVAALLAVFALAVGCGRGEAKYADPVATVHIDDSSCRPATVTVPRNSAVTIVNEGTLVHSWNVTGPGVGTTGIPPGRSIILDLRDIAPGTYSTWCGREGQSGVGEPGTLTITP